jgi:hypothetical protein
MTLIHFNSALLVHCSGTKLQVCSLALHQLGRMHRVPPGQSRRALPLKADEQEPQRRHRANRGNVSQALHTPPPPRLDSRARPDAGARRAQVF